MPEPIKSKKSLKSYIDQCRQGSDDPSFSDYALEAFLNRATGTAGSALNKDETLLFYLIDQGDSTLVDHFLATFSDSVKDIFTTRRGVNSTFADTEDDTILHAAIRQNNQDMVRVIYPFLVESVPSIKIAEEGESITLDQFAKRFGIANLAEYAAPRTETTLQPSTSEPSNKSELKKHLEAIQEGGTAPSSLACDYELFITPSQNGKSFDQGQSAVFWCIENAYDKALQAILDTLDDEKIADLLTHKDVDGNTIIDRAVHKEHTTMVGAICQKLQQAKIFYNTPGASEKTPMDVAIDKRAPVELIAHLLKVYPTNLLWTETPPLYQHLSDYLSPEDMNVLRDYFYETEAEYQEFSRFIAARTGQDKGAETNHVRGLMDAIRSSGRQIQPETEEWLCEQNLTASYSINYQYYMKSFISVAAGFTIGFFFMYEILPITISSAFLMQHALTLGITVGAIGAIIGYSLMTSGMIDFPVCIDSSLSKEVDRLKLNDLSQNTITLVPPIKSDVVNQGPDGNKTPER